MVKLYVNVDHVATVREARKTDEPDPVAAALLAELAGADGITVHLREDRRHIQDRDLELLRRTIKTKLNMEMAPVEEMVEIALRIGPDQCSLVPERRQELTTEGGLDVASHMEELKSISDRLKDGGILVSLFIDPSKEQINASRDVGADAVEINTGGFSEARDEEEIEEELEKIEEAVKLAHRIGLRVYAGHGLTYKNILRLKHLKEIEEYNIGHNIVARAVLVGFERAVREMIEAIRP